jgi:hypothetical protein
MHRGSAGMTYHISTKTEPIVGIGNYMDSARRRPLVIYLWFPFVSYLSFRPSVPFTSVPFSSDSSFLFHFCLVLAHAPFGRLVYINTPKLPLPGNIRVNQSFLSTPIAFKPGVSVPSMGAIGCHKRRYGPQRCGGAVGRAGHT